MKGQSAQKVWIKIENFFVKILGLHCYAIKKSNSKAIHYIRSRNYNVIGDNKVIRHVSKILVCLFSRTSNVCQNILHKFTESNLWAAMLVYLQGIPT